MRKEIIVMAAAAAFALVGYLAWQSTKEEPAVQSSSPSATPSQPTAPENAAAPSTQTAPAQPAQPSQ
jgi:Flp pilus assembly protein CpaB